MSDLHRYSVTSHRAAASVIGHYSTSFGAATRLLREPVRGRVRDVYAMVRVADEIVDGPAAEAGLAAEEISERLDGFEREVQVGIRTGFSVNPVVHAFAETARACDLNPAHVTAFFCSMRADITATEYTEAALDEYIYGSAEVVGLMCLDVFTAGESREGPHRDALVDGARHLGAAFQKINFLRDMAEDRDELGRDYLGVTTGRQKDQALADIRRDLRIAAHALPGLPPSSRTGVTGAYLLFAELADRMEAVPAVRLHRERIRVPNGVKLRILARAVVTSRRSGRGVRLTARHPEAAGSGDMA